ncbi:MAG: putative phage abortive infection protein, partial [Planctomycetota bacterium]
AFEQMYFRLLELRETIIGSIRAIDEVKELTGDTSYVFGRRALKKHADGALVILQAVSAQMPAENELELKARREVFCKNYGRWYDHDAAIYLGHYFRTTYHCLRLVHDWPSEDLDLPARYGYARLLRAQLSDPELELLFCNCIGPIGWTRFMPLANYYHLFDNLRITGGRIDKNNRWFTLSWVVGPDRDMIGDERRFWLHDRETKLAEGQDFVGRGKGLGVLGHDLDPWPHDEVPQADTD